MGGPENLSRRDLFFPKRREDPPPASPESLPANTRRVQLPDNLGEVVVFLSRHDITNPAEDAKGVDALLLEGMPREGALTQKSTLDLKELFQNPNVFTHGQYVDILGSWDGMEQRPPIFFIDLPGSVIIEDKLKETALQHVNWAEDTLGVLAAIAATGVLINSKTPLTRRGFLAGSIFGSFWLSLGGVDKLLGRQRVDLSVCDSLLERAQRSTDDIECLHALNQRERAMVEEVIMIGLRNVSFAYKSVRAHELLAAQGLDKPTSHAFMGAHHINTTSLLSKSPQDLLGDIERILHSFPEAPSFAKILLENGAYNIPIITTPTKAELYEDIPLKSILEQIAGTKS